MFLIFCLIFIIDSNIGTFYTNNISYFLHYYHFSKVSLVVDISLGKHELDYFLVTDLIKLDLGMVRTIKVDPA